jgi:hypothetical protein
MTNKKISELTNITGSNVDDANDEIAIVDASASETKAITRAELFSSVSGMSLSGGTIDGTTIGGTTASSGTFTDLTVDEATLSAIAETKADTAVDVFVYDTSKDSDGGAWRHRTQGTSWYNETLNTATRGSRREFPAVAVIVAESDRVTIYDGDDPSLPMWMVFDHDIYNMLLADAIFGGLITSITTLNGKLIVATSDGSSFDAGLVAIDFLADNALRWRETSTVSAQGYYLGGIGERNETNGYSGYVDQGVIVSQIVNDVAMTVLPDAPIDPATGLPVPTIAVATDGGVSVIKDDGTVVDSSSTISVESVAFTGSYDLVWGQTSQAMLLNYYPNWETDAFAIGKVLRGKNDASQSTDYPYVNRVNVAENTVSSGGIIYLGDLGGMSYVTKTANGSEGTALVNYTTSTYNTGWMNGDIKGAFLSDTDDTDLVGSGELVTNGTFDTDTDWTKGTGWTISGGVASADGSATSATEITQAITTVSGQKYVTSFEISNRTAGGVRIRIAGQEVGPIKSDDGIYVYTWVAESTSETLSVQDTTGDFVGDIDNFSTKLADEDRSVNNNGLVVNGTITREPVATGADLVSYSGFSSSNYLSQPYNPDLDFGTGAFAIIGWIKEAANSAVETILERDSSASAQRFTLDIDASGFLRFTVDDDTTARTATSNVSVDTDVWTQFVALYDGDGDVLIYLNGGLDDTESGSALLTLDNANAVLNMGLAVDGADPLTNGSLALLRISATAPTAEQIKKIHNDEKFLFQENAGAVLAGTSDAVTALAYDEGTQELLVGTSQNTSVFRGLRRVETISGSASAISASNGLRVIED